MEAARIADAQARRRQRLISAVVVVVALAVVAVAAYVVLDDDEETAATDTGSTLPTEPLDPDASSTDVPAPTVVLPPAPEGRTLEGATPCPATDGSEERVAAFAQAPPTCITEGEALEAVVETTAGSFTFALDTTAAPIAANNFVVLARYKYFDGLPFHRLLPGEYAQTGSSGVPTWGSGGPGYDLPDAEVPTDPYAAGDVAWAKGGTVSGGQWFVVVSPDAAANLDLQPEYPRFGRITEGLEVVAEMSTKGDPAQAEDGSDGNPTEIIGVLSVTIRPLDG